MQPILDVTDSDEPIFAIVAPVVRLDLRCRPIELRKRGEIDAVLFSVRLSFGLVPVPHLYAYIKLPGKGECGMGRVKVGLRGDPAPSLTRGLWLGEVMGEWEVPGQARDGVWVGCALCAHHLDGVRGGLAFAAWTT